MEYKVTVVIPVYNVEKYLDDCLKSILKQTLTQFEIIAINDGSTDKSLEILKTYENKLENMKIINKCNTGLSDTRNKGIVNARGKYILFLDSDDMLKENTLEELYEIANKNDLDLVTYDCVQVDEISNKIDYKKYSRKDIYSKCVLTKDEYFNGAIKKGMPQSPFHLYKKDFLDKYKLKFEEGILHEDELFNMKCCQYIKKIGYCNKQLYIRRFRANSIMSNQLYKNMKSLKSYKYILGEFSELRKLNLKNKSFIKFLNKRASLLMCNLLRYESFKFKDLYNLKVKYNFNIEPVRVIYNILKYKILIN